MKMYELVEMIEAERDVARNAMHSNNANAYRESINKIRRLEKELAGLDSTRKASGKGGEMKTFTIIYSELGVEKTVEVKAKSVEEAKEKFFSDKCSSYRLMGVRCAA